MSAFTDGNLLQVLADRLLFGIALTHMRRRGDDACSTAWTSWRTVFFGVVHLIMRFAPLGAFGAMAFTIGKYGLARWCRWAGCWCRCMRPARCSCSACWAWSRGWSGFSLWKFLRYIRAELLLVLGTSSSESALPRLIERLEELGCDRGVVGLVVPTGYSFNLDGTCIYLTMAAVFIAQAVGVSLDAVATSCCCWACCC